MYCQVLAVTIFYFFCLPVLQLMGTTWLVKEVI